MASDNVVIISGNLVAPAELRFTPNGQAVANLTIANNRRWKPKGSEEWSEAVSYFDVTVWGELAESVAESFEKGNRLTVTGRLEQQTWNDKETDAKRSKVIIVADDIAASARFARIAVVKIARDSGGASVPNAPNDEDPF